MRAFGFALALWGSTLFAQNVDHGDVITPDVMNWQPASMFPPGAQVAMLVGNPGKPGDAVVMRLKFPPHFTIPPHIHPGPEIATVISGEIGTKGGTTVEKSARLLPAGTTWVYPPRHPHYAWTGDSEAVVQVQFTAPGGITYVNPADDPRRKK